MCAYCDEDKLELFFFAILPRGQEYYELCIPALIIGEFREFVQWVLCVRVEETIVWKCVHFYHAVESDDPDSLFEISDSCARKLPQLATVKPTSSNLSIKDMTFEAISPQIRIM